MVFTALTTAEVDADSQVTTGLMTKIKENFDDLNNRAAGGAIEEVDSNNSIAVRTGELTQYGDTSGGGFTTSLPAASAMTAQRLNFKKISNDSNTWTIDADGSDLIEGLSNQTITLESEALSIQSDGSNWYIISDVNAGGEVPGSRTISTTAPLTGGGNLLADRTISIPQATSVVDGYLSAADHASFSAKLTSTLTDSYIFVGNGSNVATGVAVTGDITISNAGVVSIASGAIVDADVSNSAAIAYSKLNLTGSIVNADISASAAIARSKIASGSNNHVVINDGSGNLSSEANLAISRGGTNAATATAAFDNLAPTTTRGDIIIRDASNNVRLAIGSTGRVLTSNGTDPSWNLLTNSNIAATGVANIAVNKLAALTASRAVVTDGSGFISASSVTSTEIGHLSGVTSNIQTQIDSKAPGFSDDEIDIWSTTSNPITNSTVLNLAPKVGNAFLLLAEVKTYTNAGATVYGTSVRSYMVYLDTSGNFTSTTLANSDSGYASGGAPTFNFTTAGLFRITQASISSFDSTYVSYRLIGLDDGGI